MAKPFIIVSWLALAFISTSASHITVEFSVLGNSFLYVCMYVFVIQVYFGTQHARAYLIGSLLGENLANGMSWLVRKKALEEVGGLLSFTDYLAEDFFMGKALWLK